MSQTPPKDSEKSDPVDRLLQEADEALKFDVHKVSEEIVRTSASISKWLGYHTTFIIKIKEIEMMTSKLYLELFEYYSGKSEATKDSKPFPKKILKSDIDTYIESNQQYQTLSIKREKLMAMTKVCEQTLKTLNSRSFDIRNYIEYEKFKAGVN
jgi:hypothetical protein